VDKLTTITVYDGSGNMAAQTVNEYDNYTHTGQPMLASNAIQHSSGYGTTFTTRGNLTAVSKWLNTTGASIITTNQYDDAGNVLSTIDPNLNKTSYSYADAWASTACAPSSMSSAFPTKVTNAKSQSASKTYSACTGTVISTTDVNTKTTTYTYDSFDRPWQIVLPDGGSKTFCYSDDPDGSCYNAGSLFSTEMDAINKSTNLLQTTLYDGLGRVQETQLNSDPQGTVLVDTQYDADGRAYKVSNPHRSGDTVYWTTKLYDGIGRSAGVIDQDNSASSITYIGNIALSTDEAGNKRNSQTDALGRLTAVWEDPSGLNYETDYLYNGLGQLLKATQKGGSSNAANWRVRTFTYNLLGQLLCAANPEITSQLSVVATCPVQDTGSYIAGTTRYQYDNDGNLISKTAPRPNQTGTATLSISYKYDTLNRILSKSYSDSSTPSTCYQYDSSFLGIGRLTNEWTQSASVTSCGASFPPSNKYLIARAVLAYDPMGRVLNEQQYTPSSIVTGQPYAMAYTYDLAGNLTSSTSGVAPPSMAFSSPALCPNVSPFSTTMLTFVNCYDAAGRLLGVASNANSDPNSMFSGPAYAAFGGLTNATLGNNAVTLTRTYDSRLRVASETDMGNSPGTATGGLAAVTITGAEQNH
jgi:YD repeat-containing protein